MTLRALAEAAGVDFTYLSKIENDRLDCSPGVETIRDLAQALGVGSMELLHLANKLPPELSKLAGNEKARRFFQRAQDIASPKDWDALLDLLESRQSARRGTKKRTSKWMSFQWSISTDKLSRRCQKQLFFREIAASHAAT